MPVFLGENGGALVLFRARTKLCTGFWGVRVFLFNVAGRSRGLGCITDEKSSPNPNPQISESVFSTSGESRWRIGFSLLLAVFALLEDVLACGALGNFELESDAENVEDVFRFHSKLQERGSARFHRPLECGLRSHYAGFVPLPFRAESCGQKMETLDKILTIVWTQTDGNRNKTGCDEHSKVEFFVTHGDRELMNSPWKFVVPRMGQTSLKTQKIIFRFTKFSFLPISRVSSSFWLQIHDLLNPVFRSEKLFSKFRFRFLENVLSLPFLPSLLPSSSTKSHTHPLRHHMPHKHTTMWCLCGALNVNVQKFEHLWAAAATKTLTR